MKSLWRYMKIPWPLWLGLFLITGIILIPVILIPSERVTFLVVALSTSFAFLTVRVITAVAIWIRANRNKVWGTKEGKAEEANLKWAIAIAFGFFLICMVLVSLILVFINPC